MGFGDTLKSFGKNFLAEYANSMGSETGYYPQDRLNPYRGYGQPPVDYGFNQPLDALRSLSSMTRNNYNYAQEQFDPRYGKGDGLDYIMNLIYGPQRGKI